MRRGKQSSNKRQNIEKKINKNLPETIKDIKLDASTLEILSQVQNKVVNSPALNGGFDRLINKVENIENSQTQIVDRQSQIVDRVDSIHTAIFDQNDGLFSLMHQSRLARAQEKAEIDIQIANFDIWRTNQQKIFDEKVKESETLANLVQKHNNELEAINKWKTSISSTMKWVLTALGGSVATVLGKFIHDWIFMHWK